MGKKAGVLWYGFLFRLFSDGLGGTHITGVAVGGFAAFEIIASVICELCEL